MKEGGIKLCKVTEADFESIAAFGIKIWPGYSVTELLVLLDRIVCSDRHFTILAKENSAVIIGFIIVSLRRDYVIGSKENLTGYLEGVYVQENYRGKGLASLLLQKAEVWLKDNGCSSMGTASSLKNKHSQAFHEHMGFSEIDCHIHYLKSL